MKYNPPPPSQTNDEFVVIFQYFLGAKSPLEILPDTARYCQILPATARYFQILPDTVRYCHILPEAAKYCQIHPDTARH